MADITNFKVRNNRIQFDLDDETFVAKYPDEYQFGRELLDVGKEFALALWANKVAFEKPDTVVLDFEADDRSLDFWMWIAQKVHELDVYQSLSEDFDSEEIDLHKLREGMTIQTGSDSGTLLADSEIPDKDYSGALISQSPGKESVATKLLCDEVGIPEEEQLSVFIEYSSRAATHKIAGREEYAEYFDNPTLRIWSNFNELQSTLQEYTENYEPITCFWEMAYLTMELPLAVEHGLKYMMMGNQLNTGEAMVDPEGRFITFEELNQSYIFEKAYTDYLNEVLDLPIVHTSPVRPFTGYSCRRIIADREPEFLEVMQNCLRPKPANRWCGRCYKCNNSWVEFLGCGTNPADAGLDHEVLAENPHFAGENEDWGFSFPRYDRDEQVWQDDVDQGWFYDEVYPEFDKETKEAFETWRLRQHERVSEKDVDHLRRFNGKWVEPVTGAVPSELVTNMGLSHGIYVEPALDPRKWFKYADDWRSD